jgi:predicted nuclease with RNAse H fold
LKTLGIDLSSQDKNTAACLIECPFDAQSLAQGALRAGAVEPYEGCSDADLDELIKQADVVGIDSPFGWPAEFAETVAKWTHEKWSNELRDRMRFRETDRVVHARVGKWPLSVSTDRIALPAMRAMALLKRHGVTDRSGDGRFYEIYPAGSLIGWGLNVRGYKGSKPEAEAARKAILQELRNLMPWLDVPDTYATTDHNLDALVASLTVRAAHQGLTLKPTPDQLPAAKREGWIHIPLSLPTV